MRRLIHLVLLIFIVVTVRAFGGAPAAEDRLAATSRWIGDKTGLGAVREEWDKTVGRSLTAASSRTTQAVTFALDRTDATVDQAAAWTAAKVSLARRTVSDRIRSVLNPTPGGPPRQTQDGKEAPTPVPAAP
jgi:hypothetical protein